MKQVLLVLSSMLLLLCGVLSYVIFRPDVLAFQVFQTYVHMPFPRAAAGWPAWVRRFGSGHLADIFWYASLLLAGQVCLERNTPKAFGWLFVLLPFVLKLLQAAGLLAGTFDWMDIFWYCLTLLVFVLLFPSLKFLFMKNRHARYLLPSSIVIAFLAFALASAPSNQLHYTTGTLHFAPRKDDDYTNPALIKYLQSTPSPTIVLRVPNQVGSVVQANENSQIYNTIEKELAESNFIVRDRALFQKVLDQNNSNDYSKIYQLTGTDLILELVSFDQKVPYNTNQYQDRRGRTRIYPVNLSVPGIEVEFKLIQVKDNQLVGDYTFNYAPCTSGCLYTFDNLGNLYSPSNLKKKITTPYDYITQDQMEVFFQNCTRHLISELRRTGQS